ncbi:ATP-dependent helicase [Mycoplasmopsis primatum]|uniref:ATP-dependent helicase n=1 Tax=Mycoplasmopsis primatum TaxID=55604 RepID=UPI000497FC7D|nr:UvrD-helicase domain-containing protein [Mycoplasmopsis primatum]
MIENKIIENQKNKIFDSLNEEQKEALFYFDGPLRIIAGAGSGKTRVLTRKIAYLINILGISPNHILAVTFTNKAAAEMSERVKQYTNTKFNTEKAVISTFHSLCAKILREEAFHVNLRNDFQIIDDNDKKNILKNIYKELDIVPNDLNFKNLIRFFSWSKNTIYDSDEIINLINKDSDNEYYGEGEKVISIYNRYNNHLRALHSLDFDDLLIKVNELFSKNPDIVKKWAKKYSYILVDEFQDTSAIQYEIIKYLSTENAQLTIVGDPDQTIYHWRGADVNLILDFDKDFKNTKTIILNKNYRSTQKILDAANKLIKYNKQRFNKNLVTDNPEGDDIEFMHAFSPDAEVRWVVQKINDLKKQKIQLKNIAIFYRSNSYSRNFEEQLMNENINYKIFGGEKFYQRKEIKDALAFLRVIYDGNDLQLLRIINIPPRKIGEAALKKITDFANEKKLSLFNTLLKYFKDLPVSLEVKSNIVNFLNCINKYKAALKNNKISVVLEKFLEEIKYLDYINSDVGLKGTGEENIRVLIEGVKSWEQKNPDKGIKEYFEYISLLSASDSSDESLSYVSLMTVHAAKGLEFDNVFLAGMSENIFPNYRAEKNPEAMEEERRLAYVAITRAKEKLFVSDSRGMLINSNSEKKPSRFLKEMGIDINKHILQKDNTVFVEDDDYDDIKKSKNRNKKVIPGDVISHTFFGEGEVLEVNGDTITVHFVTGDIKSLSKNHQSIRVLKDK